MDDYYSQNNLIGSKDNILWVLGQECSIISEESLCRERKRLLVVMGLRRGFDWKRVDNIARVGVLV